MSTQHEVVERALAYPYAVPASSFLLAGDELRAATDLDPGDRLAPGRMPLLAYGSNAAPEVLMRKLGTATRRAPVLALRATLADHDVVYSAHISRYGSIPATLHPNPGTELPVFVLYLDPDQARAIAATEPNYEPTRLRGIACKLDAGGEMSDLEAYRSRHGCLLLESREVALTEVAAAGRTLPAMTQPQVQERLRSYLAPDSTLEQFVVENATDRELAQRRTELLSG